MSIFQKTIFTGFAPNLTARDTVLALSYLFLPWKWSQINTGNNIELAERKLEEYFKVSSAYTFDSGRSALFFAIKALGIGLNDEVLVQGYTCMVVSNAIMHSGAKPIYIDVNDDFNMNANDIEKKITGETKALIIQHTFGLAADMDGLLAIAKKYNLFVIEDCAHSLGASFEGKLLGTFGEIGMLSFGADKIVSCVRGGALITNSVELGEKIKALQNELPTPTLGKTLQHLAHHPFFYVGKKTYHLYFGKIILALAQRLHLMNKIIYDAEKKGETVSFYPSKLANSLAVILLNQLTEMDEINVHRKKIADFYNANIKTGSIELPWKYEKIKSDNCVYLRYPILSKDPTKLFAKAKRRSIILGNWYDNVIAPIDIDMSKTEYVLGSCSNAEKIAGMSVNLPTDRHISIKDAARIVEVINS